MKHALMKLCRPTMVRDPVQWANAAVGTRTRLMIVCAVNIGMGGLAIYCVRLAVSATELRVRLGLNLGLDFVAFERSVHLLLYFLICAGMIVGPNLYCYGLARLLREMRRGHYFSEVKTGAPSSDGPQR